jgi:hypothetical protein
MRAPWRRALAIVPVALLLLAAIALRLGVRSDASALGFSLLWGLSLLQLLLAYGIFYLLVRETIPGSSARPALWVVTFVAVTLAQLGVGYLTFSRSPMIVEPERALRVGATCLYRMSLIGVPILALGLVVASRGLPLRPRITGLGAGLLGGLVAEAIYRTHCPFAHLDHMLPWHTSAVALLGIVGFFAGAAWELARVRHWRERRSPR